MSEENINLTAQKVSSTPGLTISYRRIKIRIHRSTIRALGFPTHIRLLMNPNDLKLAVQACDKSERRSFKVPKNLFVDSGRFEITSIALLRLILKYTDWEEGKAYKLYGETSVQERLVLFDLKEFEVVIDFADEEGTT